MKLIEKKILITDYSVSQKILSNSSLLALLESDLSQIDRYVIIFNRDCDLNEILKNKGFNTYVCKFGGVTFLQNFFQHLALPFIYSYIVFKERPDIIYSNNVMAAKSGALFKLISNKPLVVHIRNVGFFKRTKFFALMADYFLCVSEYCMKNTLPSKLWKKSKIVFDGVDSVKFNKKNNSYGKFSKSADNIVFGMVGRITEQKGQDYFVKLANNLIIKYPHLIFLHCGENPNEKHDSYSKNLVKNSYNVVNSKNFLWLDYTNNIDEFWSVIDIAIAPSQSDEAFGRVIIEAMSSQIPVISTSSGGPSEIIQNGINGFYVPKNNYPMLESRAIDLIEDYDLRKRLAVKGRELINEKFSSNMYAQNILRILETL